jgi:putative transposase
LNIFNGELFRTSAPTTYGFQKNYVFAIKDPDEVLYKYEGHNRHVLVASPIANPELKQTFPQDEIRQLVEAGKLNPRVWENRAQNKPRLARFPELRSSIDLPEDEMEELDFYWLLCRHIVQMHTDGKTSLTDLALKNAIAKVMSRLVFGADDEEENYGRGRKKTKDNKASSDRTILARKRTSSFKMPSPSTVRRWIRLLEQNEWDVFALRDHRKGRVGFRAPKITNPQSASLMASWVREYLDRSRPTISMLYKLMVGSKTLEEENEQRDYLGKVPLRTKECPSFAVFNVQRVKNGLEPLPVPSKSTFERAIRKLDKFEIDCARKGPAYARRKYRVGGRAVSARFPGQRVVVDCWRTQLMTLKLPHEFWVGMDEKLIGKVGKLRLTLCVAIDEATKVVLGAKLSVNADAQTALSTLELVCRDKTKISEAAGCVDTWNHTCTPTTVATDSGSEFIDERFRGAVGDIGSGNEIGPAGHPDARGVIERVFGTLDAQFMQFFQGRTFSGITDKGDYDPVAVANVLAETLGRELVRYIVDIYHNAEHGGLGGQTPNEAWVERAAIDMVLPPPPPHVVSTVFGFSDNRRIQNRGVRFLGLFYRSEDLGKLRRKIGQKDIRIRADLENLGTIWVSDNVPGARWFALDCDIDMEGVPAALWMEALALLKRHHADVTKLSEHIVLAALYSLQETGRFSAAAQGIGPSTLSDEEFKKKEEKLTEQFNYTTAKERGRTFEGMEGTPPLAPPPSSDLVSEQQSEMPESVPVQSTGNNETSTETSTPTKRRRRGLGADFLRKDQK